MKENLGSEWHQKLTELVDLWIKNEEAGNARISRGLFKRALRRLRTEWKENNLPDNFGEIFKEILTERQTERNAGERLKQKQEADQLNHEEKLLVPYKHVSSTALANKMKAFLQEESLTEPDFWEDLHQHAEYPASGVYLIPLERDFRVFARAVRILRRWGRDTYPGVYFNDGPLPSDPLNPRILISDDPVSSYLRGRWQYNSDDSVPEPEPVREQNRNGMAIEIELGRAVDQFCQRIANATVSSVSSFPKLINFTVHSQNSGFRLQRTYEYWYSPVVFGRAISTPVSQAISPTRYKFGGDRGDGSIIWDSGIHEVSASNTQTTTTAF
jgi:hypothetical protein